jgi:hypothetical protein
MLKLGLNHQDERPNNYDLCPVKGSITVESFFLHVSEASFLRIFSGFLWVSYGFYGFLRGLFVFF